MGDGRKLLSRPPRNAARKTDKKAVAKKPRPLQKGKKKKKTTEKKGQAEGRQAV